MRSRVLVIGSREKEEEKEEKEREREEKEEEEQTVDIRDGVSRLAVSEHPSVMAVKRKQHPVEKLKEALSSKKAFQKCYLV